MEPSGTCLPLQRRPGACLPALSLQPAVVGPRYQGAARTHTWGWPREAGAGRLCWCWGDPSPASPRRPGAGRGGRTLRWPRPGTGMLDSWVHIHGFPLLAASLSFPSSSPGAGGGKGRSCVRMAASP